MIRHVRQIDPMGCIIASLAMMSGRTYEDLRPEFPDLEERGGLDFRHTEDWLYRHGYAWQVIYKYHPPGNSERPVWPAPPWADVHMCEVTTIYPPLSFACGRRTMNLRTHAPP